VSLTKEPSTVDANALIYGPAATAHHFTLRDLYERASISGTSLLTELERHVNLGENEASQFPKESSRKTHIADDPTIHEKALVAILDVVVANRPSAFDCVQVPEPPGGVREWWARMSSGSTNHSGPAV